MKKNAVTISDVAKIAGVSKTTISRYLNGKFEFMSDDLRTRIAGVIEDLNYRPNNLARSLKSSKSQLIGVIFADISNPVSTIIAKGITDCCKQNGYNVLIANTDNDAAVEREYLQSMVDHRVEGIIVLTGGQNNDFLWEIAQKHVPVVLVDRPTFPFRFDTVKTNDYASTVNMVSYLREQGFRRVGFFSPPVGSVGTRIQRREAYRQACKAAGLEPQEYVVDDHGDEALAEAVVKKFMAKNAGKGAAIFTSSGVTMLSVIKAVSRLGLRIPEDVGVCGFDDWPWAELVGPGITAISQPSYDVGAEAVKLMIYRIQAADRKLPPKLIELTNKLFVRGSTRL